MQKKYLYKKGENFMFLFADGSAVMRGRDHVLNRQNKKMTPKPEMISGRLKGTLFVVITQNLEFISSC